MDAVPQTELLDLLDAWCDGRLTTEGAAQLDAMLREDPQARWQYLCYMELHGALQIGVPSLGSSHFTVPARPNTPTNAPSIHNPSSTRRAFTRSVREAVWHPIALLLILGFVSAGILAYVFSTRQAVQPVVQKSLPAEPAAKLVSTTDAKWAGPSIPDGEAIKPGQRLVLQRGSAEIVFGKQARVIFEGPADFVITDSAACRLDGGKLTAHVPEPARGFKVQTPDGTVTDLGTEFGVYVKSEVRSEKSEVEEQQEEGQPQEAVKLPPITEVHVFKGQVDITTEQLSTAPESKIQNPKSKILSAGQAVTISQQKVESLPAADPFKFALDKLQGKPRKVLLSEDFETYKLGGQPKALIPWIFQGGTRKGQGVYVVDPAARIAQLLTESNGSIPHASPGPAVGQRVAKFVSAIEFPKNTYPLLAREIDCREFAGRCQVLVEFDLFTQVPQGLWTEPSLAFAAEVGQAPGIALWQNSDTTAPKIAWLPLRWYHVRVLLEVTNGSLGEVQVERSLWSGAEGWVRDSVFTPPVPKVEWKVPPRYVVFGFPVPPTAKSGGLLWLDNIRIEVISKN